MVRWQWVLACVLLWASCALVPVLGIDNSVMNATGVPPGDSSNVRVLQEANLEEKQKEKEMEDRLRAEIEQAVKAQMEEKLKREMEEKHTKELEEKHKQELEARRKRDMEEAERKRKEEEERKQKEEAERKQKEEAERKQKEEAERKQKEEAERKQKEEAERKQKEEAERKQKEEAERKQKEEAERKQKEEEEERKQKEAEEEKKRKETEEEENNFQHVLNTKIIPELKQRCSTFPQWTAAQVERCLSFAEDGIEYDPLIFDLDDEDFSFDMDRFGHVEDESSTKGTMLKVAFVLTLIIAYLRHVNWFRKSPLWNAIILKARTIIHNKHRHTG